MVPYAIAKHAVASERGPSRRRAGNVGTARVVGAAVGLMIGAFGVVAAQTSAGGSPSREMPVLSRAIASSGWSLQHTANPSQPTGHLRAVSCTSSAACTAVGFSRSGSGATVALAERWDGSSWKIQNTPSPAGATTAVLSSVSCSSRTNCIAVGYYINSAGHTSILSEAWDGTAWSQQNTPVPIGGPYSLLNGVSCSSAKACIAVGKDNVGTLAMAWDGTTWNILSIPSLPSSELLGVSCSSAGNCTSVGDYVTSNATVTLAERWNGITWGVQSTPNSTLGNKSILDGVSCSSTTACMAVGNDKTLGALAESWDGSTWSMRTTPTAQALTAISCTSASACIAVGDFPGTVGSSPGTLAERWDGTAWSVQNTPNPSGSSSFLSGVSCTSGTACTAVGLWGYSNTVDPGVTLAEVWSGTSWSIQTTPNPSGIAFSPALNSVSCASATACTATGSAFVRGSLITLAERWNGTAWSIQPTPNPDPFTASTLASVSCPTSTDCVAVGNWSYENMRGPTVTLAEAWNGVAWSILPTPNPTGARGSFLRGVSCTSATACVAAGEYQSGPRNSLTLVEAWNGTAWSVQPTPNPTGATGSFLRGVTCTSATACTAVGYYQDGSGKSLPLAEAWNGTSWSIQPTPNPTPIHAAVLESVSCSAATTCTAVGSNDLATLAESWNGTAWSVQPTPSPATSNNALLNVSCPSPTACTAVGFDVVHSQDVALAEAWNGTTWSVQATPNLAGGIRSRLSGVSCTSGVACVAVGNYQNAAGAQLTLAEAEHG